MSSAEALTSEQEYCLNVCKSACCRRFTMSHTCQELMTTSCEDAETLLDMVVLLDDRGAEPVWRCRYVTDAGCAIYDRRPRMCSRYGTSYKPNMAPEGCIYTREGA